MIFMYKNFDLNDLPQNFRISNSIKSVSICTALMPVVQIPEDLFLLTIMSVKWRTMFTSVSCF